MTASKFDISSFRAEPPLPTSSASSRSDRAGDNAFADILRAQNVERDMPAAETHGDDAPRDDVPTSPIDKPAPRQATKEKESPAKPRQNDSAKNETSPTPADVAAPEDQAKPKTAQSDTHKSEQSAAPTNDAVPAQTTDIKAVDVDALQVAVASIVPVVPAPIVVVAANVAPAAGVTAPAESIAAPVAPIAAPTPDASAPAGGKEPAKAATPQSETPSLNAAPAATETASDATTPDFDQLVAASLRAAPPRETRQSNNAETLAPAAPAAKPAAPVATPAQTQAAIAPQAQTAAPASITAPIPAAPVAAAPAAPSVPTDGATISADAEVEAASLAALVKRPAAARNAEPRPAATTQINATALSEPTLSDAEPIDAPAPRSGAGMLTAATGLAAQVKGQELQNMPQPAATAQTAATPEKMSADAVTSKTATLEVDTTAERDAPNTPSTARTSDGQAAQPTHETNVRGTSFADALGAARGARASANPLVEQVVVQVTKAVSEGNDRITIKLSPADLGRIEVRLDIGTDGKIQAVFAADKPQTVELLQRDARELERALQDAGLRADSGSLSFNLRGEQRDANGSPFSGGKSATGDVDALAEVPAAASQIYSSTTAGNGRLDIHV